MILHEIKLKFSFHMTRSIFLACQSSLLYSVSVLNSLDILSKKLTHFQQNIFWVHGIIHIYSGKMETAPLSCALNPSPLHPLFTNNPQCILNPTLSSIYPHLSQASLRLSKLDLSKDQLSTSTMGQHICL